MLWGLPGALSIIVSTPVRAPAVVGWKAIETLQLAPGLIFWLQVLVWVKLPLVPMLEMVNVPLPVLVRVTNRSGLLVFTSCVPKVRPFDDKLTTGAVPVPLTVILCGLPTALSVMLTAAVRVPVAVGANVMFTLHADLGCNLEQLVLTAKSAASAPLTCTSETVTGTFVEILLRLDPCGELLVPTFWLPKVTLVVEGARMLSNKTPFENAIESSMPSPLKSPTTKFEAGMLTGGSICGWKVPSPLPRRMETGHSVWNWH